jgi:hypothetical protein
MRIKVENKKPMDIHQQVSPHRSDRCCIHMPQHTIPYVHLLWMTVQQITPADNPVSESHPEPHYLRSTDLLYTIDSLSSTNRYN